MRQFLLTLCLICTGILFGQCPPPDNSAGVNNFTTQTEIDNYILDYPNCTELTVFVNIYDEEGTTDPITNLNGLANLERIDGRIKIFDTSQLTDLTGLSGLTEITGGVTIFDNTGLESLDGIENLTTIGTIDNYEAVSIHDNSLLTNVDGFQNIDEAFIDRLTITNNPSLINLEGINDFSLDATTPFTNLTILDNTSLSLCTVESVCTYISTGGVAEISGNAPGCEDLSEVTTNCQIVFPNCPEGDVILSTQAEVDQFIIDYPNCAVIPGVLNINDAGTDPIVNLDGLQNIQTVYGLYVQNTTLTDFSGLDALTTISGDVVINATSLTDVSFLSGFTSIGGSLTIMGNANLTDLSAFSFLEEIDGVLEIMSNNELTSLNGLENIIASSIDNLVILGNPNLSVCSIESVCIYLANGFPSVIMINNTGCNNNSEIESNCNLDECPPTDVNFFTQAELDYFALQYPNCTEINGNVDIGDLSNDITDLQALENITTINGYLTIESTELTSFNGLHNLENINGSWLAIGRNDNLTNLQGFDNLTTVPGMLIVSLNDNLETFTGLESLTTLGSMDILDNPMLQNLDGLNNIGNLISTTTSSISITSNDNLQNIDALSGVTYASHDVRIQDNPMLQDISGLSNLTQIGEPTHTSFLRIQDNHTLTALNMESLEAVYGKVDIVTNDGLENLDGLSSLASVWGLTIQGNNILENIEGLSNLSNVVQDGFEVQNFEIILNPVLTSLTGLENITKAGRLEVSYNDALTSYEGLSRLQEVGWDLILRNNPLVTDLSGLENLTEIGVEPHSVPVSFVIWEHNSLDNVEAFSNLESINYGDILIAGNPLLTSLSGLDNIDPTSIAYVELLESATLSDCAVPSVCGFLTEGGIAQVANNATGCNNTDEIITLCGDLGLEDLIAEDEITLHPVPVKEWLNIKKNESVQIQSIKIYNMAGELVHSTSVSTDKINVGKLSPGVYSVVISTEKSVQTKQIIKK